MKNEAVIGGIVVGGQPDAADIASGRYTTIINCRPASEEGNVTAELVASTDIRYAPVPFTGTTLANQHIDQIRSILDGATGTTLVHCNGGTRAAVAVAIVNAERAGQGAEDVVKAIEAAGFDIKDRPYEAFIEKYFDKR
jgi:uncharacterized protein (TIGR01244 family)